MNLFSLRALWKGIKGKSLTFSLIFAMAIMGLSFAGILRHSFRSIGLWGPLIWVVPLVLTGWLAKNEYKLKITDGFRRFAAYGMIFGSISLAYGLFKYEKHLEAKYPVPEYLTTHEESKANTRRLGPRGK